MTITGEQEKAARLLLRWSQDKLAADTSTGIGNCIDGIAADAAPSASSPALIHDGAKANQVRQRGAAEIAGGWARQRDQGQRRYAGLS
jgi:hypothetical protein